MFITIKKGATKAVIGEQLAQLMHNQQKSGLRKYFEKFLVDGVSVEIQRKLRSEWN